MGQAKQRGTFKERQGEAIQRDAEKEKQREIRFTEYASQKPLSQSAATRRAHRRIQAYAMMATYINL